MEKLSYKITMELDGTVDFPFEKGSFSKTDKLKNKIKDYVQKSLGCKCTIKECKIQCSEE